MDFSFLNTWTFWLIAIAVVTLMAGVRRKIPILSSMKPMNAGIALAVLGLIFTGGLGAGLSFQGVGTSTENGQVTVMFNDAEYINTSTTDGYYNSAKNIATLYFDDADIADDGFVNTSATIYRTNVADASTIRVTCNAPDMTLSGVTQTSLVSDASGLAEMYVSTTGNSGGIQKDANTVYYDAAFAVGANSATVYVSFKQDETWEDAMIAYQTTYVISCDANGIPFQIQNIARD